jgi:hypothetical protein
MIDWLASHVWGVLIVLVLVGIVAYCLKRPLSWRDGEVSDTLLDDNNPLLDTDRGSLRHGLFWSDELHPFFRLREWWQREREKHKKD